MKYIFVLFLLINAVFSNTFENKKIIKLNKNDDFYIINLNQNINYNQISNITTLALIPSYEKEYNFYFPNLKINSQEIAIDTLKAINTLIKQENHFALLSQKENETYIRSENLLHPDKNYISSDEFLEFSPFKKADIIILLDLKSIEALKRNFVFFSNFKTKTIIEYKIYNAKTKKLKDYKTLTIQSDFTAKDLKKSYQEFLQTIAKIIHEDIKNTI